MEKTRIIVYILAPLFFIAIPSKRFEEGRSICPSQLFLNRKCPGCGMTRAISNATHLRFKRAWGYNKKVVIVLPLLIYVWIKNIKNKL